jgi:hypothetical protein
MNDQQTKKKLGIGEKITFGATPSFKKTEVNVESIEKAAKNMLKDKHNMKRLTIDIDGDLHSQLKIWSVNTGITMRDITLEFYQLLCSGNIDSIEGLKEKLS